MTVNLRHKVSQLVDDDKMLLVVRAAGIYVRHFDEIFYPKCFQFLFAKIAQNYSEKAKYSITVGRLMMIKCNLQTKVWIL